MYFVGPTARNLTEKPMAGVTPVNEHALDAIRQPGAMSEETARAWQDVAAQLLALAPEDTSALREEDS